jgi:uncharacterized membrane-anchored protein
VPVSLALVFGCVALILVPAATQARPAVALAAAHIAWWIAVIAVEVRRADPTFGRPLWLAVTLEPALFGVGAIWLAVRWFAGRRRVPH